MKKIAYVIMDDYRNADSETVIGPVEARKSLFKQAMKEAKKMQRNLREFNEPADISIYRLVKELPDEDF